MKSGIHVMTYQLYYRRGHPAGYTDDLGIIADRNQWVEEELPGWYCFIPYHKCTSALQQWCNEQFREPWSYRRELLWISDDDDATLFNLTWQ